MVWIDARSNVHPIHTRTDGLEGYVELEAGPDGHVDPTVTPKGHLSLRVDRLRSGNVLEQRELRRRIEARRFPSIDGELIEMRPAGADGRYVVHGAVTFRGVTKEHEDEMLVALDGDTVKLSGTSTFDIRDYGMEPPRILMLRVEPEVTVRVEIVGTKRTEHG
jgi:polyisoprenoid-binding protein YceI